MGKYAFVSKVAARTELAGRKRNEFSEKFEHYLAAYDKSRRKQHSLDERQAKHDTLIELAKKDDPSLASYQGLLISERNAVEKKQRKVDGAKQALEAAGASLLLVLERIGKKGQEGLLEQFRLHDLRKDEAVPLVFWAGAVPTSISIIAATCHFITTGVFGEIGVAAMGISLAFVAFTAIALRKSSLAEKAYNRLSGIVNGCGPT